MVILGSISIFGGLLSLLLPETLGALLPETIEEVALLNKNEKGFFQCWSKAKLKVMLQEFENIKKKSHK